MGPILSMWQFIKDVFTIIGGAFKITDIAANETAKVVEAGATALDERNKRVG